MSSKTEGTVKWFDTKKGYGFIVNESGEDCMVHSRAIQQEGFKNLVEGSRYVSPRYGVRKAGRLLRWKC